MKKFIELFAEQLDALSEVTLNADTRFRELDEWTSLVALSVIAMVDEEYGVSLSGNDIRGVNTLGELYNLIQEKL